MRTVAFLAITFLLVLAVGAPASAEGGAKGEAQALIKAIQAAQKHPEREGLDEALGKVPATHNGLEDAAAKKGLQKAVGKVLTDKKAGQARAEAARVLGQLDDPKGASKALTKILPKPKDKVAGPAQLEALKSIGLLAQDATIPLLLKLVQKGKSIDATKAAIAALGGFGKSKKRVTVLTEILETMGRLHAAAEAAARNPKGGAGGKPWEELGETLISTANTLTGQKHGDVKAWLEAYKTNKKKPAALFASAGA